MRKLLSIAAATLLAGGAAQAAPADREAELARALEGRVAGAPVTCIDLHRVRSSRVIPNTAIIYNAGGTLYVNRPRAGARSLNKWDALVTRTPTTRLCSVDSVQLVEPNSGMMTGVVMLDEFVPYRRVD